MPAPHQGPADNLVRTFGFEPVDRDCPRDAAGLRVAQAAQAFRTAAKQNRCGFTSNGPVVPMSALPQGLRRPYGTDRSAAMELTSRLLNDDRAEDHDGPIGFESKTERARLFAAKMVLPVAHPAGCPRACDRGLCRHHWRDFGSRPRHPLRRLLPRSSVHPV